MKKPLTTFHTRIKDILNGLYLIDHQIENRNIIKLPSLPRSKASKEFDIQSFMFLQTSQFTNTN